MIEEELPDELENDLDDIEPVGDESQLYEHFRVVVDKGQAMVRVDKYLFERIVNASRNRIQKAAEDGFVMANGKPVKSSYKVKPLDVITVMMDRPRYENEIIPEDIPLNIVYEDPYLMVVNKPAGLVVHPGHGNYHGTLVNALAWHMKDNADYDANDPQSGRTSLPFASCLSDSGQYYRRWFLHPVLQFPIPERDTCVWSFY